MPCFAGAGRVPSLVGRILSGECGTSNGRGSDKASDQNLGRRDAWWIIACPAGIAWWIRTADSSYAI